MTSYFKEGSKINFNGIRGTVIKVTETYRKNVIVVKISEFPKHYKHNGKRPETIGLFELPNGSLEFMNIID
jgi:hypothetical protein